MHVELLLVIVHLKMHAVLEPTPTDTTGVKGVCGISTETTLAYSSKNIAFRRSALMAQRRRWAGGRVEVAATMRTRFATQMMASSLSESSESSLFDEESLPMLTSSVVVEVPAEVSAGAGEAELAAVEDEFAAWAATT